MSLPWHLKSAFWTKISQNIIFPPPVQWCCLARRPNLNVPSCVCIKRSCFFLFDLVVYLFAVHSLSGTENQTWDGWVGSANASSVLCRPPLVWSLIKLRINKVLTSLHDQLNYYDQKQIHHYDLILRPLCRNVLAPRHITQYLDICGTKITVPCCIQLLDAELYDDIIFWLACSTPT